VRDALAATGSWDEFADWLSRDGVLVRPRMSTLQPGEVTGYAVALRPTGFDIDRTPVWFSGGKLAPDLTLPRLQRRWAATPGPAEPRRTQDSQHERRRRQDKRPAGWAAREAAEAVRGAQRDVQDAAGRVGPGPAVNSAAAASDVLHAVSRLVEWKRPGPLRQAAEDYDRATRPARRSRTRTTSTARALRAAARGLALASFAAASDLPPLVQLLEQLAALADAVAALRQAQEQAARAAAARVAATTLHEEAARYQAWTRGASLHGAQLGPVIVNADLQPPTVSTDPHQRLSR
jgi:hypothetical protein